MNKKSKLLALSLLTSALCVGVTALLARGGSNLVNLRAGSEEQKESNVVTITANDLVSHEFDGDFYHNYSLKGSSKYYGLFYSDDNNTFAYGDYENPSTSVTFNNGGYILTATSDQYLSYQTAFFKFSFTLKDIYYIEYAKFYVAIDGEDESEPRNATIKGLNISAEFSNEHGVHTISLKQISFKYFCL